MNRLFSYSKIVAFFSFCLIMAGGLVTSTGSGLSVPDWPLSYGKVFPPMIGGIRFEHSHRVIAGFVGILTFILTGIILKTQTSSWVRTLGIAASIAVVAQALLGGLTVIYLLPTAVSVTHACLGQIFFTILCSIALLLSPGWKNSKKSLNSNIGPVRRLVIVTAIFVFLQLVAGAVVRHTAGKNGLNFHLFFAFLILIHTLFITFRVSRDSNASPILPHTLSFLLLVVSQILLGGAAYFTKFYLYKDADLPPSSEILIATAHQSVGALILATAVLLVLRSFRLFQDIKK